MGAGFLAIHTLLFKPIYFNEIDNFPSLLFLRTLSYDSVRGFLEHHTFWLSSKPLDSGRRREAGNELVEHETLRWRKLGTVCKVLYFDLVSCAIILPVDFTAVVSLPWY